MHLTFFGAVLASVALVATTGWHIAFDAAVVLTGLLFGLLSYAFADEPSRAAITARLRSPDPLGLYARIMDGTLTLLARMMAPAVAEGPVPDRWWRKIGFYIGFEVADEVAVGALRRHPLSWPLWDTTLRLAIIYPLLALLVQWGLTGEATGVGEATILQPEERDWLRAALIGPLAVALVAKTMASASPRDRGETVGSASRTGCF
jgi:hypothetical protein